MTKITIDFYLHRDYTIYNETKKGKIKMKLDLFYYTFENGKQVVSIGRMSFVKFHKFTKKYGKLVKVTK